MWWPAPPQPGSEQASFPLRPAWGEPKDLHLPEGREGSARYQPFLWISALASASVRALGSVLSQQASSSSSRVRAGLWGTKRGISKDIEWEELSQGFPMGNVGVSPRDCLRVGPGWVLLLIKCCAGDTFQGSGAGVLLETNCSEKSSNLSKVTQTVSGRGYSPRPIFSLLLFPSWQAAECYGIYHGVHGAVPGIGSSHMGPQWPLK